MGLIKRKVLDADIIADRDVLTYTSVPSWLASGHPLRRRQCQVCGELIGGQSMRVVVIVPMTECTCPEWELHSVAYLVCASHEQPDALGVAAAAMSGHIYAPGRAT